MKDNFSEYGRQKQKSIYMLPVIKQRVFKLKWMRGPIKYWDCFLTVLIYTSKEKYTLRFCHRNGFAITLTSNYYTMPCKLTGL